MSEWGARIALCAAVFFIGLGTGHELTADAYRRDQAAEAGKSATAYREAVDDGATVTEQLQEQQRLQGRFISNLIERLGHAPLVARQLPGRCAPVAAGGDRTGAAAAGDGAVVGGGAVAQSSGPGLRLPVAPADAAPGVAADGGVPLSLAAVSLWDSASFGRLVPAGACGVDGTADDACAAESGVTLADAWRNHALNAASCAADRARYRTLIDFLRSHRP